MKSEIIVVLLTLAATISSQDELLVATKTGPVHGVKITIPTGKLVDTFYGIPFAQPPVDDLRFRRPQSVIPWVEIFNATNKPNACYQLPDTMFGNFSGATIYNPNTPMNEDCLYLNIWIPNPRPKKSAILVWIYGGGFSTGSSALELYDGSILAGEENIIVASMNYRLAALGFFYLGTEMAPGNMGLLDQQMALEWLHDNIASFGGDPNKITIFGESAGSASVSYHLLSHLSRNLFSRAIMESGAATAKWAWNSPETAKNYSLLLSEKVGCSNMEENLDLVVDCLKQKDANTLISTSLGIKEFLKFGFAPVTDNYFLIKPPIQHLLEDDFKKCPILAGTTYDEGTYFLIYNFPEDFPKQEGVIISRERFLKLLSHMETEFMSIPGEAVSFEYTNWLDDPANENYVNSLNKIVADKYIHCPLDQFADAYSKTESVYMYQFAYRSVPNPWPEWMGIQHGDELFFVFGVPLKPEKQYTPEEMDISRSIMKYWANFARSGNPNLPDKVKVEWPEFKSKKEYLKIEKTTSVQTGFRAKQCAFWDHYFPTLLNAICKK